MKSVSKKLLVKGSRLLCLCALSLAVLTANSTCVFLAYQPDVPDELK